jgi:dolichyl-phosphate-mannose-protein mannosyltransferase
MLCCNGTNFYLITGPVQGAGSYTQTLTYESGTKLVGRSSVKLLKLKIRFWQDMKSSKLYHHPYIFLLIVIITISALRLVTFNTDTNFTALFIEEKQSGYSGRTAALGQGWDSGGGWFNPIAWMPTSTILTFLSFKTFGLGQWQFELPYLIATIAGTCLFTIAIFCLNGLAPAIYAIVIISFSPFMLSIFESTLNENLYFLLFGAYFLFLSVFKHENKWFLFFFGLIAGLAASIKLDGITLFPVTALFIIIELRREKRKNILKNLTPFFLGGCTALAGIILFYSITSGLGEVISFYVSLKKANIRFIGLSPVQNISQFLYTFFITLSKNLSLFNPWFFFFACLGCFYLPTQWKKQNIASRFSILFIVFHLSFLLTVSPILYFKRLIPVIFPFFFIGIDMLATLLNHKNKQSIRNVPLSISASIATLLTMISFFAKFTNYILPPTIRNAELSYNLLAVIIILGVIVIGFIFWNYISTFKAIQYSCIIFLLLSILYGLYYYIAHHNRRISHKVSLEISQIIKGATVVADAPAVRFFAYDSKEKIQFISENDPNYPFNLLKLLHQSSPEYFISADWPWQYNAIELVKRYYKNYKLIKAIDYFMPPYKFENMGELSGDLINHYSILIFKKKND